MNQHIKNAWREELLRVDDDVPDADNPGDAIARLTVWPGCKNEATVWLTWSDLMLLVEYLKRVAK